MQLGPDLDDVVQDAVARFEEERRALGEEVRSVGARSQALAHSLF